MDEVRACAEAIVTGLRKKLPEVSASIEDATADFMAGRAAVRLLIGASETWVTVWLENPESAWIDITEDGLRFVAETFVNVDLERTIDMIAAGVSGKRTLVPVTWRRRRQSLVLVSRAGARFELPLLV